MAAAEAIFSVVGDDLAVDHIVPSALDPRVGPGGRGCGGGGVEGLSRLDAPAGGRARRAADRRLWRTDAPSAVDRVGAGDDPESALLAQLYAAALRYYGSAAHVEPSHDPLADLDSGDVTVVPGFTGRLLHALRPRCDGARRRAGVPGDDRRRCPRASPPVTTPQSAEDKPALAVTEATARKWGGRDVTALVRALRRADGRRRRRRACTPAAVGTCRLPRRANSRRRSAFRGAAVGPGRRRRGRRRPHPTCPTTSWCSPTARR